MLASDKPQQSFLALMRFLRGFIMITLMNWHLCWDVYTNSLTTRARSQMIGKVQKCVPYIKRGYIWCQKLQTNKFDCTSLSIHGARTCASHINKFLANTHILNSKQHGFRQGLSCQTQLIEAINDWVCSLNSKRGAKTCQITVALFDFSKTFDRVCHKRLLLKLDCYGIRGPMREWIDSFLQDRTQTVSIQGVKSSSIRVVSGVPEGSVLGPLLFLLFINDIDNNIHSPLRLFPDDTILYREIWSKDDHKIIQNDIQTLFKWSQTWKLDFNVSKCKVLTISNKKDPNKFNYNKICWILTHWNMLTAMSTLVSQ